MAIPVIDIFAGPGGLGEGFSALFDSDKKRIFKIALSIEKDFYAHKTLTLRSFFRQFEPEKVPDDYYEFLEGSISLEELYHKYPEETAIAKEEAWLAELGIGIESVANNEVDDRIKRVLNGEKNWLLIGGPPCQAYSVVGRSRRQEKILDETKDHRVGLYKQYLRILAVHSPAVFVMENVKGLLSAETKESPVFSKILRDLANPFQAYISEHESHGILLNSQEYRIYSLVVSPNFDIENNPVFQQKDFVIRAEKYGIPQTRHRVILLGVRKDINVIPDILTSADEVAISDVLSGLPRLRSSLTKIRDDEEIWKRIIKDMLSKNYLKDIDREVREEIMKQMDLVLMGKFENGMGANYIPCNDLSVNYRQDWFLDKKLKGVCNHFARGHMESDLYRYLFASCFAKVKGVSPKLQDFPSTLLPNHENVKIGIECKKFADRFRVQLWSKPSKTITSHISKDGHYYIHPDPAQCRSLTVREAARIQTFSDNYYFCGPRTAQFIQVGNAVPPLLAKQIAKLVADLLLRCQ